MVDLFFFSFLVGCHKYEFQLSIFYRKISTFAFRFHVSSVCMCVFSVSINIIIFFSNNFLCYLNTQWEVWNFRFDSEVMEYRVVLREKEKRGVMGVCLGGARTSSSKFHRNPSISFNIPFEFMSYSINSILREHANKVENLAAPTQNLCCSALKSSKLAFTSGL